MTGWTLASANGGTLGSAQAVGPGLYPRRRGARSDTPRSGDPRRSSRRVEESRIREWAERARAGDPDAFGEIFRAYRGDVERLCRRLLQSAEEAEDATSEVFLRARKSFAGYDTRRPLRRWLLAVASNHCVDRLRRRATEHRIFEPSAGDADDLAAPGPSPLRGALLSEARKEVLASIHSLPDRYRVPLVLRYYADLDYDTIGEHLGVERNQVATLLFRAKQRLRKSLVAGAKGGDSP